MYEKIYQLKSRPFSAAPNLLQYHPTEGAETALRNCREAVDRQAGPALILGAAGMGKTLLLDLLADGYSGHYQVVTLACARTDTRRDLLQNILFQLGQTYRDLSESELRLELADYLRPGPHCPHGLLCLVDDAHCLVEELMDELRVLAGFIRAGQLRFQLVLTGTQRLEEMLTSPRQESFNQKISTRSYLNALSQIETAEYVRAHLRRAGGGNREFFSADALKLVHRLCQGIPRLINQLCDAALQRCARQGSPMVTPELCQQAWTELQRLPADEVMMGTPAAAAGFHFETNSGSPSSATVEFGILSDEPEVAAFTGQRERAIIRDEAECEGRSAQRPMLESTVKRAGDMEYRPVIYPTSTPSRGKTTEAEAKLRSRCDLDPDFPDAAPAERKPAVTQQPTINPFEETFETEEVVTEAFLRGAIAHNQTASELTRAILDEFQVDRLEMQTRRAVQRGAAESLPMRPDPSQTAGTGVAPISGSDLVSASEKVTLPFPAAAFESSLVENEFAPLASSNAGRGPLVSGKNDDRDMLVVSKQNQMVSSPGPEPEEIEDEAAISTGRAYRMDYKQLFSRLRNSLTPPAGEATSSR